MKGGSNVGSMDCGWSISECIKIDIFMEMLMRAILHLLVILFGLLTIVYIFLFMPFNGCNIS